MMSNGNWLTPEEIFFRSPEKPPHRQYEALRAYFVERLPSQEVAERFGYSPGAFRVLCHEFRHDQERQARFFKDAQRGPHGAPKRDPVREAVIHLRKQNLSVYDIQRELAEKHIEVPKTTFLSTYSTRVDSRTNLLLMSKWSEAVRAAGFRPGSSFDFLPQHPGQ